MEEQLISFETAKLAKEKGFDILCKKYYNGVDILHTSKTSILHEAYRMYAPTQSLLQKWLREKHKTFVYSNSGIRGTRNSRTELYFTCQLSQRRPWKEERKYGLTHLSFETFKTYEEAIEKGLQEALKLIK